MKKVMYVICMSLVIGISSCSKTKKVDPQMELFKIELKKQYETKLEDAREMFKKGQISETMLKSIFDRAYTKYVQDTTACNK